MEHFTISEMQDMQTALQEQYKDKWEPICPAVGQNKLLWMIGEIGAQTTVPVLENDTPEILAARVLEREHTFLVEVIVDIISGKIALG